MNLTWQQFKAIIRWHVDVGTHMPRTVAYSDDGLQSITRYYVAQNGYSFFKIMPSLPGNKMERYMAVNKGMMVKQCNHMNNFDWGSVDREWYIAETMKLVLPVMKPRRRR